MNCLPVLWLLLWFNLSIIEDHIVLQTRHKDWQAGGLETKYYLSRLKEADSQIKQYEESAAPSGWSCHWDRYALPCHHVTLTYITKYGPSHFTSQLVNKRVGRVDIIWETFLGFSPKRSLMDALDVQSQTAAILYLNFKLLAPD